MINYCIEIFIYQALFIGLYQVLKSEPLFKINRLYLLMSLMISLVLPLINFVDVFSMDINETYVQWLQPININTQGADNTEALMSNLSKTPSLSWSYFDLIYGFGLLLYSLWFLIKNRTIFKHLKRPSHSTYKGKKVVILPNSSTAFSFWNRIYLGEDIPESQREIILEHEYQHLRLKHSWDMIVLELLQFILWFNPLIYIYKKHLRQIHEFEADRLATQNTSKSSYVNTLLNQSFGCQNISFVNSFYQSSNLKKRIKMLHKTHSMRMKYLLILPALCLAVFLSCTQDKIEDSQFSEDEMQVFLNKLTKEEPSFFERLDKKPDLKSLLNAYDLDIKDEYSENEEGQVALVLGILKLSTVYKNDQDYQNRIDNEINQSIGLQNVNEILQEKLKANNIRSETEVQELDPNSDIPFAKLDQVPHPSSCNDKTGKALKQCVSEFISTHVNTNFNTGLGKELGLTGTNRVSVQFKIDKSGHIVDVRARGPHPKLEQEAQRVIKSLPQMIPGQVDGKNVSVLYGLPINFVIQ
ncbi:M56 family metallopeptidase [Flavobacteriaceae bacterium 14752]|uniref:M56 family metallopeptidase n=1 Tax=Mesohalobacter salilacus TaxID=2491711 RepID=UPI000F63943C|nr:M56 family peptidase [Flavobacteriaceae bacterium 14752]